MCSRWSCACGVSVSPLLRRVWAGGSSRMGLRAAALAKCRESARRVCRAFNVQWCVSVCRVPVRVLLLSASGLRVGVRRLARLQTVSSNIRNSPPPPWAAGVNFACPGGPGLLPWGGPRGCPPGRRRLVTVQVVPPPWGRFPPCPLGRVCPRGGQADSGTLPTPGQAESSAPQPARAGGVCPIWAGGVCRSQGRRSLPQPGRAG